MIRAHIHIDDTHSMNKNTEQVFKEDLLYEYASYYPK